VQQADAAGKFGFGRIAQELPAWTSTIGNCSVSTWKRSISALASASVSGRAHSLVRMTIAAEKPFNPKHVSILRASHDERSFGAGFEETDATENQHAHNRLAKLSSAISNARNWSGGMTSASSGPCACGSTRAGRPGATPTRP
jgi:hypothetical protein